jgi:hypothetical protein
MDQVAVLVGGSGEQPFLEAATCDAGGSTRLPFVRELDRLAGKGSFLVSAWMHSNG